MFQASPNPFFSQDKHLSQLNCTLETICSVQSTQETQLSIVNFSSWTENLNRNCCKKECLKNAQDNDLLKFKTYYSSLSKEQQEIMTLSLLQSYRKVRQGDQREHYEYYLHPFGSLCRNSFIKLFGISDTKLIALSKHLKLNGVVPRKHGNNSRKPANALTDSQRNQIVQWIKEYATREGEPSSGRVQRNNIQENGLIYLPAHLTIVEIYKVFEVLKSKEIPNIGYELFRQLFQSCDNIRIRSSRSDICDDCILFKKQLNQVEEPSKLEEIGDKFNRHLHKAKSAREEYKKDTKLAKDSGEFSHISFDFAQNMYLPHLTDQASSFYFFSLFNVSLFGVLDEGKRKQMNYIYSEADGAKGSNNVLSMLMDYYYILRNRKKIIFHCDNCVGQNKNNGMIKLLCWLCLTGRSDWIELKFMVKGHTKFGPDGYFGMIKKVFHRTNTFSMEHLEEVVKQSSNKNMVKVFPSHRFKNFRRSLDELFNDLPRITKYRYFKFTKENPGVVMVRTNKNGEYLEFNILKKELETYEFEPKTLKQPGLKSMKAKELYEKVRPFVPREFQDTLCPKPIDTPVVDSLQLTQEIQPKRKRKRTRSHELLVLEELYSITSNPEPVQITGISEQLNWNTERVTMWFANKRARLK